MILISGTPLSALTSKFRTRGTGNVRKACPIFPFRGFRFPLLLLSLVFFFYSSHDSTTKVLIVEKGGWGWSGLGVNVTSLERWKKKKNLWFRSFSLHCSKSCCLPLNPQLVFKSLSFWIWRMLVAISVTILQMEKLNEMMRFVHTYTEAFLLPSKYILW